MYNYQNKMLQLCLKSLSYVVGGKSKITINFPPAGYIISCLVSTGIQNCTVYRKIASNNMQASPANFQQLLWSLFKK